MGEEVPPLASTLPRNRCHAPTWKLQKQGAAATSLQAGRRRLREVKQHQGNRG